MIATSSGLLIIGYGNELRGDDAAGPRVARAVGEWRLPSVRTLTLHQLVPEIAADLAQVDTVIFIDACCSGSTVQLDPIDVCSHSVHKASGTHSCSPIALLSLTQILYGRYPQAWLLQIPANCFDVGDLLSDLAHNGCDRALEMLEQFIVIYQQSCTRSV